MSCSILCEKSGECPGTGWVAGDTRWDKRARNSLESRERVLYVKKPSVFKMACRRTRSLKRVNDSDLKEAES